jgi:hypothetical protein
MMMMMMMEMKKMTMEHLILGKHLCLSCVITLLLPQYLGLAVLGAFLMMMMMMMVMMVVTLLMMVMIT